MNKRGIADSNILISYFTQDEGYVQARESIRSGVLINTLILTETLNFIHNKYSAYYSQRALSEILKLPGRFVLMPADYDLLPKVELLMHQFLDNRLSFVDCFILAQAEKYDVKVLTSDERMGNYTKVKVINPLV